MGSWPDRTGASTPRRAIRSTGLFLFAILAIEFLDELVFGAREAAWPLIRDDLGLGYDQVGLLLGVPAVVSSVVEPFIGVLGDVWRRSALILGGGLVFALALLLTAVSSGFWLLLLSFVLFYPASGAFVSLAQATLMDSDPERHEHNMARWTFAGSLGVVIGPLALGGAIALGAGWRDVFLLFAALTVVALALAWRVPLAGTAGAGQASGLMEGLLVAWRALRRRDVLRWLVLLEFSDLMLDVLLGFLALYMVDVAGMPAVQAGLAVVVWTGVGLLGDLLLIPLLERVSGLRYLRVSAVLELLLFPAMLLAQSFGAKLVLLGLLGLFNAGWYSILKAQLYNTLPGQSGTVMTLDNVFGLAGALLPIGLGLAAREFGLSAAMWLLLLGPLALVVGLPRAGKSAGRLQSGLDDGSAG